MEGVTVDQVDAVVEESFFEKESSSKSSWKFCNQTTLPRSEVRIFRSNVCYFTADNILYC